MTNDTPPHVLIAEDDADVADLLVIHLSELPCTTDVAITGAEALSRAASATYDGIVLDVGLPLLDGLTVCQQLRQRRVFTPILMLTARVSEADRIVGLEIGADDYLTKPFSPREFQARIKSLLRRAGPYSAPSAESAVVTCGDLRISVDRRRVTRGDAPIDLTAREFDLLLWMAGIPATSSRESSCWTPSGATPMQATDTPSIRTSIASARSSSAILATLASSSRSEASAISSAIRLSVSPDSA